MRRILKLGMLRRQYDIAQQRNFAVSQGWSVDSGNHRDFNLKEILQEMLAFPVDSVPGAWRAARSVRSTRTRAGKFFARAGQDDYFVFRITTDISEGVGEISMRL